MFHPLFKGSAALCVTHADGDLSHPKAVRIPDLPDKFLYPLSFGKCPVNFDFFYIHKRVGIDVRTSTCFNSCKSISDKS